jgi:tellurite resistance protein
VLDLSVVYDLQLNPDDPEDVLMVFGYALGVAPTELVGAGARKAAGAGTATVIKKYISKDVLKAIQNFARKLGFKILQRTILKYAVPVASAAVGSSYNYTTTRSLGRIAKTHLKNRGRVTEELRMLVSRQNTYDLVFPAAAMYTAQVDGEVSPEEKALYRAILSRMSFDEHTQAEFQKLSTNETHLLEAASQIEDDEIRHSLVDLLALVAVCDGELADEEREFLDKIAECLDVPVDLAAIEQRSQDYHTMPEQRTFDNLTESASGAAGRARDVAGRTAESAREATIAAGGRVRGALGNFLKRTQTTNLEETPSSENPTTTCSSCGTEVQIEYRFCPNCGLSTSDQTT